MQRFVQYAKFSDLNTDAFKEDLKTLENTINSTKQNVTDLRTQISGVLREQSGGSLSVQELKSLTKNITNLEQFQKIQQDILKNRESNYQAETNRLEELQKQTEELRKQLQLQKQAIENPGDTNNQINKYRERRDNYQQRIDRGEQLNFGEQMAYEQAKREYNRLTDTSGLQEQIKQNEVEIGKLTTSTSNYEKVIQRLRTCFQNIQTVLENLDNDSMDFSEDNQRIRELIQYLNTAEQSAKDAQKAKKDFETEKVNMATGEMQKAIQYLESLGINLKDMQNGLNDTTNSIAQMEEESRKFNTMKERVAQFFSLTSMFYAFQRAVRSAYEAIKELDAAFTEIAVVTDMTNEQLWDSFDTYNRMAQELGATTVEAIETSALYYQQGLETAEVMELTEETIKMARIAGMDFAEATDRMTSALRGFKLEMEDASRVNDVFSALAAESAVDTDELSAALTRTASIAESAGMSLETTSAFLSQMIETTRESPENLGTAMKTIVARFQELKTDLDEVEVDGEIVDANKVETALRSVGVALRDELTGQFRDLDDVFLELSAKWDSLDRNTQRYVATIAAGSRQQSRFIAMMDNYERTMELVNIAQDSAGASADQFSKTMDSVQTRLNNIQASFEELVGTLIGNDLVKGVLTGINNILQAFNSIANQGPVVVTLFTVAFIKSAKSIFNSFLSGGKSLFDTISGWISNTRQKAEKEGNTVVANFFRTLEGRADKSTIGDRLKKKIESANPTVRVNMVNATDGQPLTNAQIGINGDLKGQSQNGTAKKSGISGSWQVQNVNGKMQWTPLNSGSGNQLNLNPTSDQIAQNTSKIQTTLNKIGGVASKLTNIITPIANIASSVGLLVYSQSQVGMTGSVIGSTAGSAIGGIIGAFAGPAGSALGSALGNVAGTFLGARLAEELDKNTYGIGSEKNINRFQDYYSEISERVSKTREENDQIIELGNQYLELSNNINRTTEEQQQLEEAYSQLVDLYPNLLNAVSEESNNYERLNDQIEKTIQLKEKENALGELQVTAAQAQQNYATAYREFVDSFNDVDFKFTSSFMGYQYMSEEDAQKFYDAFGENILSLTGNVKDGLSQYVFDFSDVAPEDFAENIDLFKNLDITSQEKFDENFEKIEEYYNTFLDSYDKELEGLIDGLENASDLAIRSLGEDTFASQNIDIIQSFLPTFTKEDFESHLGQPDFEQFYNQTYEEYYSSALEIGEKINDLSEKEREIFVNAYNMIGMNLDEEGNVNISAIRAYIEKSLDQNGQVMDIIEQISQEQLNELGERYSDLTESQKEFIKELQDQGLELEAYQYASLSRSIGADNLTDMMIFQDEFLRFIQEYRDSANYNEIIQAIGSVNVESASSIANLMGTLRDLNVEETDIVSLTSSLGSVFNRAGLTASEALTDIENHLESANSLIEILGANLEGSLSISQVNQLNEELEKMNGTLLDNSQIFATGNGFTIQGDIGSIIGSGTGGIQEYFLDMANQANAGQFIKEYAADQAEANGELEEANSLRTEANELAKTSQYYLMAEAQIRANTIKQQLEAENAEKQRLYDLIQQYKDMIAEMERYYNIQRKILQLQNEQKDYELDLDLAQNSGEAAEARRNQILNLVEQQALLAQAGEIYQRDLQKLGDYINQDFGQFLTVDESGNIFQNTDELVKLAERMKGASEEESEELQKQWDEIQEVQSAYEDLYDTAISNSQEYKKNLIEQRELETEIIQDRVDLETALRDMIIAEMEAEVEATKEKYDKIKDEDQKYLSSLQKNINKRKQMMEDQDSEEEISTLQQRIGLLSRDTSGIYNKEIESLQAELEDLLQERENTALDRLYEEEQQKTQIVADNLTARSEFLQAQLDLELETYAISNEKVAELLKLKDEEILNWMKEHSEEFRRATTREQELFIRDWTEQIKLGKAEQDTLTQNLEDNKVAILTKFQEIKTGGIDVYIEAMKEAAAQKIVMDVNTDDLKVALQELENLNDLQNEYVANEAKRQLDSLLVEIENAYAEGDKELGGRLKNRYSNYRDLYEQYGGNIYEGNALGYKYQGTRANANYASMAAAEAAQAEGEKTYNKKSSSSSKTSNTVSKADLTPDYVSFSDAAFLYYNDRQYRTVSRGTYSVEYMENDKNGDLRIKLKGFDQAFLFNSVAKQASVIKYAKGGLVDYTGPAWVDGTPSKPEAFLSASDTANIAKLRDILSKTFNSNSYSSSNASSVQNNGDTYYEFHITVDELGDGYDAEQMMKDMEKYIVQKSNYRKVTNLSRSR